MTPEQIDSLINHARILEDFSLDIRDCIHGWQDGNDFEETYLVNDVPQIRESIEAINKILTS